MDGTIFAGPQVYPGPGPSKVKFLGSLTVLFEVPPCPTLTWKAETEAEGSCPHDAMTPPLQQLLNCWLKGTPGSKSTTVGVFLQQCGVFPLNLEQSPCSVV